MEITRIFTDTQGDSHFERIPVLMEEKSELGYFSDPETKIQQMYFRNAQPHHIWDFHPSQNKIYISVLEGSLEIETSDGEKRRFEMGDVILLDDHSGTGHKIKTFDEIACLQVVHLS